MSASASTPFMHNDRGAGSYGRALAKHLGAPDPERDMEASLRHLRRASSKSIGDRITLFKDFDLIFPMPWKPYVDGGVCDDPFLPLPFAEAVRKGLFNADIPILAGSTTEEGLILSSSFHRGSSAKK